MNGTMTKGDKIFNIVNDIIMALLCIIMIYPVLFVVGRSVTPEIERALHPLRLIPSTFDWSGYKFILSSGSNIVNSYLTTITRTLIGTTLNLIFTTLLAYPLSKNYYPLRKPLTAMIVFTMWFSGGLIPSFLLNKSLGLLNNFWVYILPNGFWAFNMLLMRTYFDGLPRELEEAAKLDGAGDLKIFFRIIIPCSMPIIAVIAMYSGVWQWNAWYDAMVYITKSALKPLQAILQEMIRASYATQTSLASGGGVVEQSSPEGIRLATLVVTTLPIVIVMIGAVKA